MSHLLDSNVVIALLNGDDRVLGELRRRKPSEVLLPSIVLHELYYGAFKSRRREANLARFEAMRLEILAFDRADARASGEIRARLVAEGTPIGPYDVLIAGQALARDLILVTRNTREFSRVPGLKLENWQDSSEER